MNSLGRHIVVEYFGCEPEVLDDVVHIEQTMLEAARKAEATIINSTFHHFSPFGVSGVVVIQESHLAIHTWPEYGFASVDIFTCGDEVDPWVAYNVLLEGLKAEHGSAIEMGRGQKNLLPKTSKKFTTEIPTFPEAEKTPKYLRNVWFTERDDTIAFSLRHTGDILYRKRSPFQKVEVYDTFAYGKALVIDDIIMTTEKDEYVYHEMMAHVPMQTHPNPERVLIIGGGDGGVLREVTRYENLQEAILVEIDELVIEATRIHFPQLAVGFDHPKAKVLIEDGIKYVVNAESESFDIIMVDSTDPFPEGPGERLFTDEFYQNAYRILKPNGLLITQSESPRYNVKTFQALYKTYKKIFGENNVYCYLANTPTYPAGIWSFSYNSKNGKVHPLKNYDRNKVREFSRKHNLKYYNEDIHPAAFALPGYVKEMLQVKDSYWKDWLD